VLRVIVLVLAAVDIALPASCWLGALHAVMPSTPNAILTSVMDDKRCNAFSVFREKRLCFCESLGCFCC